uniref:Uncharacterized protein n=1 Tax=Chrysotila carterae TaxID=13221 RepID=A0A7S4F0B0_CHRCT|mmetsp:Transcript_32975/g.72452  ORF Transcript_32975/g.72452 Transcript_32975/m.72452 type:complete len:179 (-) Transcript_32975:383-919(-)
MAKSLRSKVKKRLRTVKRGVIKKQLADPQTKLGAGPAKVMEKLKEAGSGFIKPGKRLRSAFRYDDDDAEIAQHNWRQGPDFRSSKVGYEAGYALVGARRPKKGNRGGDAPNAIVHIPANSGSLAGDAEMETEEMSKAKAQVTRLHMGSEQFFDFGTSKRAKRKLKNKSGTDHNIFRWT